MPKQTLMCEICREVIGTFHEEDISEPIKGAMFQSKDPVHGFPAPFRSPALEWEHMRCPYCQKRPFLTQFVLMTSNGFWSTKTKGFVDRPQAEGVERSEIDKLVHERYVREEHARFDTDAERLVSDIDDRIGTVKTVTVDPEGEAPPTEEIPLNYGPDARVESEGKVEEGPKYEDLTQEEKEAEAKRRIALDEAEEEEKPQFKHPCPFCELGYKHLSSLNRHVSDKHGDENANSRSASTDNDNKAGLAEGDSAT